MSPYLIVFIFMLFVSIAVKGRAEIYVRLTGRRAIKLDDLSTELSFSILFLMLLFCSARSQDYYIYRYLYNMAPGILDINSEYYTSAVHTEILWKILCVLCKTLGISDELYIGIITSVSFYFLHKFLNDTCKHYKIFAHLWAYSAFYLVYYYIGIRSGLAISLFLCKALPMLKKRKIIKYDICVIVLGLIHTVAFIYLFIPIAMLLSRKVIERVVIVVGVLGTIAHFIGFYEMIVSCLPTEVSRHLVSESLSFMHLAYRIIFIGVTMLAYGLLKYDANIEWYYKVFLIGAILYFISCGLPVAGVRIFDLFNILEIVMISECVKNAKIHKLLIWLMSTALIVFMYFYHIHSGLNKILNYTYNVFDFPYISIFDEMDILESLEYKYLPRGSVD